MSLEKSEVLRQEESVKVADSYLFRPLPGTELANAAAEAALEIAEEIGEAVEELEDIAIYKIETCAGWIALVQDQLSSTIAIAGDSQNLPTGTVVGCSGNGKLTYGDRVRFNPTFVVDKNAIHPAYGVPLLVIDEKHVFFKLS